MEEDISQRRIANEANWKRNIVKSARVKGEKYIDYKGREVPAVSTGFACGCKNKCTELLAQHSDEIFVRLRSIETKNGQDILLQSLITSARVKNHRPRKEGDEARLPRDVAFKYHVLVGDTKEEVCINAFKSLYGIKISRIRRLRTLLLLGKSPKDMRGKKEGTNAIPGTTRILLREHVDSFPVKESKYAGKTIKYLDARMNKKIIFNMFKEKHPTIKCSYAFFSKFYNENYFGLKFGRPQIDSCCTCEELGVKLRSPHLNDAAKRSCAAELMIHRRRAKKFYNKLKLEREKEEPHVLAIAFDYMQNIPLPIVPVQETFYLRQLSTSLFCIHNIKINESCIYLYHEGTARKSPDEVCSLVYNYLNDAPPDITEVHVYSDNCGGQNKNHALNRVFLALTDSGRFKRVEQYFPIRGHSYLPCDRDFSIIKRSLRKYDRLYTVHQLTELIITSSNTSKFTVAEVETSDIKDFQKWWPTLYKKNCVSEETRGKAVKAKDKIYFGISSFMHFSYGNAEGIVTARNLIDGLTVHTYKLSQVTNQRIRFPEMDCYELGKVPIKPQKLEDIRKLQPYIPFEYLEFFNEILEWPTGKVATGEDEHDIE